MARHRSAVDRDERHTHPYILGDEGGRKGGRERGEAEARKKMTYIAPVLAHVTFLSVWAVVGWLLSDKDCVDVASRARHLDHFPGAFGGATASSAEDVESGKRSQSEEGEKG